MDPDQRRIDGDIFEIRIIGQGFEDPLLYPLLCPSPETRVDGEPLAERLRQIAPRRSRPCDPQHRLDEPTIVGGVATRITDLAGQLRCNPFPLAVVQHGANQG